MLPSSYHPRAARIGRKFVATCDALYPNGSTFPDVLLEPADANQRLPLYDTEAEAIKAAQKLADGRQFAEKHDQSL